MGNSLPILVGECMKRVPRSPLNHSHRFKLPIHIDHGIVSLQPFYEARSQFREAS